MNNFQLDRILRTIFLLGFIVVLVSCPIMPEPQPTPSTALTAVANADQTDVTEGAMVTLSAEGSTTPSSDPIAMYAWVFVESTPSGTTVGNLSNDPTTPTATFTAPDVAADTILEFKLTVTTNAGKTASSTVSITVSPASLAAIISIDQANILGKDMVTLSAEGSTTPSIDPIASYTWVFVESTPSGTTVDDLSNDPATPTATFTAPDVAADTILEFRLTVTTNAGETASSTINITIAPAILTARAGEPQSVVMRTTNVMLDGSRSTAPTSDPIASHNWAFIESTPAGTTVDDLSNNPTTPTATFTAPDVTAFTMLEFRLTITSDSGETASDTVIITVTPLPPTAEAGDPQSVATGTDVTLGGSGMAASGGSLTYQWQQIGSPPAENMVRLRDDTTATPTFTAPDVAADTTLEFELTVTEDNGTSASDTVMITVFLPPTADAGDDQSTDEGQSVTLNASRSTAAVEGNTISYLWDQTAGTDVYISDYTTAEIRFKAPFVLEERNLEFSLTVTDDSDGRNAIAMVMVTVSPSANVDADGDDLIEIDTLEMLHNMRFNLAGSSYKTSAGSTGLTSGCPDGTCSGYELTQDLNFDRSGDGRTWTGNHADGFTLNADDNNDIYFDVDAGGWSPIGVTFMESFNTTFDGNGHTITNLAIKSALSDIGFFGYTGNSANIRNIGLIDNLTDHTGSGSNIGIGGLVGQQFGTIIASYATGSVDGGAGTNAVGGLVGRQFGTIIASYATGSADGDLNTDSVGGLVGHQGGGKSIIASYATGDANGGGGTGNKVAGVIASSDNGNIIASYATGNVKGSDDSSTGQAGGRLTASTLNNTNSYGFGMIENVISANINTTGTHPSVSSAAGLTLMNAGNAWDDATKDTKGAWDFGTTSQTPAVKYADYDGPDGSDYSCDMFPAGKCDTIIPGQGR